MAQKCVYSLYSVYASTVFLIRYTKIDLQ